MPRPRKERVDLGPAVTVSRGELWQGIAEAVREGILSGAIRAGADLVEGDLAARFGVSRGPVRDALRELAREGLVVDLPRRGTIVSTLTFADIQEVYEVREGLEITAATLVIARASDEEIAALGPLADAMESAWSRRADYGESLALDLAFHRALVALTGNSRLIVAYEQMLSQTQLLIRTAEQVNPRLRHGLKRSAHRDILWALAARDVATSRGAIAEHYVYARERLFSGQLQVPAPAAGGP
jgi:DNA-binding GntR family transcriptional regulator